MTETPQRARDDAPALAAYATFHGLGEEAAAAEWRFVTGEERERFRAVARAAVAEHKADGIAAGRIFDLLEAQRRLEAERDDYATRLRAVDRSWARLAAERDEHRTRLAMLLADTPFEFRPDWAGEYEGIDTGDRVAAVPAEEDGGGPVTIAGLPDPDGCFDGPQALDHYGTAEETAAFARERQDGDPFGVGAFTGHGPGCGCGDCEGARTDAAIDEPTPGPVYGGDA